MGEHGHDAGQVFGADFWDERYRSSGRIWSGNPNRQLVAEVTGWPPGLALDVGCGEGADAIWLARAGWTVVGTDISGVALERAAQHATDTDPAAAVRENGMLLIVGHHPSDLETGVPRPPMPEVFYTPEEIAGPLGDSWTVRTCVARPRPATTPDGTEVTVHDTVLAAVRGSG